MTKSDFDRLTAGRAPLPDDVVSRCHAMARAYRDMASSAYAGPSGADRADAPGLDLVADLYGLLAAGADPVESLAWACDGAGGGKEWLFETVPQRSCDDISWINTVSSPRCQYGDISLFNWTIMCDSLGSPGACRTEACM